jgi:hypothetical protein
VPELFGKLRPAVKPGVHVNFMSGDEQDLVHEAYHERWDHIVAVKSPLRPKKLFPLEPERDAGSPAQQALIAELLRLHISALTVRRQRSQTARTRWRIGSITSCWRNRQGM